MSRTTNILLLTRRLIILAGCALLAVGGIFGLTLILGQRFMLSWTAFGCGIVGGFVSIQQRLRKIDDTELELLTASWFQVLLIPVYGGIFSIVLYVLFLSGIISGHLFPSFDIPQPPPTGADTAFMTRIFLETYPSTAQDLAKLLFWSFVAGFSERFVPQIIANVSSNIPDRDDPASKDDL